MRTVHAVFLAAFVIAETLLFLVVAKHHYAWSYPRWSDQLQYLGQSYGTFELARAEGYVAAISSGLSQVCAQGCLHEILTLPIFAAMGATRTAALAVNVLALAAWQVATFLALRRVSGRYSLAWASVGLLIALNFPWSGKAGSAVDFRLDWMATCAFGVALAVAAAGCGFRSTRWAVLFGAVAGATVLLRFLTAVYFALIFVVLLAWLLTQRDRSARCARLGLAGLVALAILGPAFWHDRQAIYDYYWVDHFKGPGRALHDSHLGVAASMRWVLTQIVLAQVGIKALLLGIGAAVGLVAVRRASVGKEENPKGLRGEADGAWVAALAFLGVPALVLACHPIKDEPPASILIPGAAWFIFLTWTRLSRQIGCRGTSAIGVGMLAAGALVFVSGQLKASDLDTVAVDYRAINGLSDFLFFRAEAAGLSHPIIGVSRHLGGVDVRTIQILSYERHKRMLAFLATLPTGLDATSESVVMKALSDSDFVCLATRATVASPFDRQMVEMQPVMHEWCEAHMDYLGSLETSAFAVSIYERADLRPPTGEKLVGLVSMVEAASSGPAYRDAGTPAAPIFVSPAVAVGSTGHELRYKLGAAYTPVRYHAVRLPEGMTLDAETGEIRCQFRHPGIFSAVVSASNSSGTTEGRMDFHIEDGDWFSFLTAPPRCTAGVPFDVQFGAFDANRSLNFIDVTDLTTRTVLRRFAASDDERQSWSGTHRLALTQPGPHTILMRFVRYDPNAKEPYSFVDHRYIVEVAP